jgi:glycosyltransferase involved in cell wall biosynthesis
MQVKHVRFLSQSRGAQIVVPSKNTKRDLVEHYHIDAQKIAVIHHGVSSLFTEETILPREEAVRKKYTLPNKFILFLGTIEPRKNIPGLIEGFELATAYIPEDVHLVIAGSSGWQNEPVFKRLANSPFKNRITHIGYVEPRDKPFLYRAAELFIYPSFYEGFGFLPDAFYIASRKGISQDFTQRQKSLCWGKLGFFRVKAFTSISHDNHDCSPGLGFFLKTEIILFLS